jgi:hypothetical protein
VVVWWFFHDNRRVSVCFDPYTIQQPTGFFSQFFIPQKWQSFAGNFFLLKNTERKKHGFFFSQLFSQRTKFFY